MFLRLTCSSDTSPISGQNSPLLTSRQTGSSPSPRKQMPPAGAQAAQAVFGGNRWGDLDRVPCFSIDFDDERRHVTLGMVESVLNVFDSITLSIDAN
jgi:hypothetical protein